MGRNLKIDSMSDQEYQTATLTIGDVGPITFTRKFVPVRRRLVKSMRRVPLSLWLVAGSSLIIATAYSVIFEITLWDWLKLLVVPLVLAAGGYGFAWSQSRNVEKTAARRTQDDALQAYLDNMGKLLLDKGLRTSPDDSEVRTLARAQTLTVLGRLDEERKGSVLQFLYEANLVSDKQLIVLRGADLSNANLLHANLSGANLSSVDLTDANLSGANLNGASLTDTRLKDVDLSLTNLRGADLSNANLNNTNLRGADVSDANLQDANLSGLSEIKVENDWFGNFRYVYTTKSSGANLSDAILSSANLSGAILSSANLSGAILISADLTSADLTSADLTNADLSSADLSGANLGSADLTNAALTSADLSGAILDSATLVNADLSGATLANANLIDADLSNTSLGEADLSGAILSGADLDGANLDGANLSDALLNRGTLSYSDGTELDIQEARNLTQEQVEQALGNQTTNLPDGLQSPKTWGKSTDEQTNGDE